MVRIAVGHQLGWQAFIALKILGVYGAIPPFTALIAGHSTFRVESGPEERACISAGLSKLIDGSGQTRVTVAPAFHQQGFYRFRG